MYIARKAFIERSLLNGRNHGKRQETLCLHDRPRPVEAQQKLVHSWLDRVQVAVLFELDVLSILRYGCHWGICHIFSKHSQHWLVQWRDLLDRHYEPVHYFLISWVDRRFPSYTGMRFLFAASIAIPLFIMVHGSPGETNCPAGAIVQKMLTWFVQFSSLTFYQLFRNLLVDVLFILNLVIDQGGQVLRGRHRSSCSNKKV